jgi:hypothetical protein
VSQLKLKYGDRSKTKSTNFTILLLYKFILEHENWDTDYWWGGGGDHDLNRILEAYFTDFDWEELEEDLEYWTTAQLEIFLYCIMNGYTFNFEHDNILDKPELIAEITKTVPQRTNLISPLLKIGIERGRDKNELSLIVSDEFFFIVNHFDVLMKADPKYLAIIGQIMEVIGKDYLFSQYPKFKTKYEESY